MFADLCFLPLTSVSRHSLTTDTSRPIPRTIVYEGVNCPFVEGATIFFSPGKISGSRISKTNLRLTGDPVTGIYPDMDISHFEYAN